MGRKGDVITEETIALGYTGIKQRKGADLNEGKFEELVDPAAVSLGGVLVGLAYYYLAGCAAGSCAITSNPINSMLYMGLMGWLLSGVFSGGCAGGCNL